ncbi:hypothetical protein Zmor_017694 [Zophobas morio]|uniref:Cytochrome P450 n=1 Tax=Zophobas morio TaxID=2755281 RepID=A0AA38I9W4_9CUCU|nr:hypothetical protein Zmor_017694 [Zophobas morio]
MFITKSITGDCISLVITFLVILIGYFKWSYQYWHKRNVPYLQPQIPFGNIKNPLRSKEFSGVTIKKIYDEMKTRGWKHGGLYVFNKPNYFPIDLDLVKNVMTKDFQHFVDRNTFANEKEPLHEHLLNLKGAKWRNLRAKLTPTFTSGKMKMMFSVMAECQEGLQKRLEKESLKNQPIDIKEVLACFTTNIIGTCAFGLEFKALEDEDSAFREFGRQLFTVSKLQMFKIMFIRTFPKLATSLNISAGRKETSKFIMNIVEDTVGYREKNNYTRNDFMQLLINLKNKAPPESGAHDGKPLTMNEIASQAIVFFAAGFETSSTLMTFALYELSKNPNIQEKLRSEINEVLAKHQNNITYDSIQDIKYLTQVIDETFRMHPPVPTLNRKCTKDYKVENQDAVIEEGTPVLISVLGIHYDKDYYPNPEKFDPERFSDENRKSRHHYAHLPFGDGPRNCIGMRFGLLQSKMGLVSLIRNFKFSLNEKTKQPLIYKPNSLVLSVEGEVWLNAERINTM